MTRTRFTLLALTAAAGSCTGAWAWQEATAPSAPAGAPPAPATPPAVPEVTAKNIRAATAPPPVRPVAFVLEEYAAQAVSSMAMVDLRLMVDPAQGDYVVAAHLLEGALGMAPKDEEMLRRLVDAWGGAKDPERTDAAMRKLLLMAPSDTVLQLRHILTKVDGLQNADDRVAVLTRFLGAEGASLDPSVRSRLALEAARLERERGDLAAYPRLLARAQELDSTNKEALSEAARFYCDRLTDPVGRAEMILALLYADPFNVEVHLAAAREFAATGAHAAAKTFYEQVVQMLITHGEQVSQEVLAELHIAVWCADGAGAVSQKLYDGVENRRKDAAAAIARLKEAGRRTDDALKPDDVNFVTDMARVMLIASAANGDDTKAEWAINELEGSVRREQETAMSEYRDESEEVQAQRETWSRWTDAELMWMRLWSGRHLDQAEEQLKGFRDDPNVRSDKLQRFEGWLMLRQDRFEEARSTLEPIAREDPFAALGLALIDELKGDKKAAGERYTELSRRLEGSLAGAYARTRAEQMTGAPVPATGAAMAVDDVVKAIPSWFTDLVKKPRQFMSMSIESDRTEFSAIESPVLTVKIRNLAPIPLALGPGSPIESSLLLVPKLDCGLDRVPGGGASEVVSAERRLRLMPQETIEIRVHPRAGALGWFGDSLAGKPVRMRWRVLQGFRVVTGYFVDSIFNGLTAEGLSIMRASAKSSAYTTEGMVKAISEGTGADLADALLSIRFNLTPPDLTGSQLKRVDAPATQPGAPIDDKRDYVAIVGALVERYAKAPLAERLLMLAELPAANRAPAMAAFDEAARKDADPACRLAFLVSRVTSAEDPLLAEAEASSAPSLKESAPFIRERLKAGKRCFATMNGIELHAAPGPAGTR